MDPQFQELSAQITRDVTAAVTKDVTAAVTTALSDHVTALVTDTEKRLSQQATMHMEAVRDVAKAAADGYATNLRASDSTS